MLPPPISWLEAEAAKNKVFPPVVAATQPGHSGHPETRILVVNPVFPDSEPWRKRSDGRELRTVCTVRTNCVARANKNRPESRTVCALSRRLLDSCFWTLTSPVGPLFGGYCYLWSPKNKVASNTSPHINYSMILSYEKVSNELGDGFVFLSRSILGLKSLLNSPFYAVCME